MIVFAIDTALNACSVAIVGGERTLFEEFAPMAKGHAEALPGMAMRALAGANVRAGAIDRICVVVGPGQFTGVRVGLAFARGFVIGRPGILVGFDSLRALRESAPVRDRPMAPVIDARRGEVFAALYDAAGAQRVAPFAASPEAALERLTAAAAKAGLEAPAALFGSGVGRLPRLAGEAARRLSPTDGPEAIDPAAIARLAATIAPPASPPAPIYLRAPDARPNASALFADPSPPARNDVFADET